MHTELSPRLMNALDDIFDQLEPFRDQPIHRWHPPKSVEIDIRIDTQGIWHYQGSPIIRERISKLFATVLRLEDGAYFLVTPAVKYRIQVDDVPFQIVELRQSTENQYSNLYIRTNMDDVVLLDSEHQVAMRHFDNEPNPIPYVMVRDGLQGRLTRSVYYELVDLAEPYSEPETSDETLVYFSAGESFTLGTLG